MHRSDNVDVTLCTKPTAASQAAERYLHQNRAALSETQPLLAPGDVEPDGDWTFGRDGYLTRRDHQQRWLTGCSLPLRAAQEVLRKLDCNGPVACFLAPAHAAQLRIALQSLAPEQAIIAIVPEAADLPIFFSCDDFSRDLRAHRLWMVAGESWQSDLHRLLLEQPGLAIPTQYIRLPATAQEVNDALIAHAQPIFSQVTSHRAAAIGNMQSSADIGDRRELCAALPTRFRLWNDLPCAVGRCIDAGGSQWMTVDLDDPAASAPMNIAQKAHDCGALLTIDTMRADSPGILHPDLPWISLLTLPRVAPFSSSGRRDCLLVTEEKIRAAAIAAGWPEEKLWLCDFPPSHPPDDRIPEAFAIIENTAPLHAPQDLAEFSSHLVLWRTIAAALSADPFALGADVLKYLEQQARQLDIAPENLDRVRFVRDLILPAYAQGIARALLRAKLPIKLFGKGWDRIDELAEHAAGAIATRTEFDAVISQPLALVHVWPWSGRHPVDAQGKRVLRAGNGPLPQFLSTARKLLTHRHKATGGAAAPISPEIIKNVLARAWSDS